MATARHRPRPIHIGRGVVPAPAPAVPVVAPVATPDVAAPVEPPDPSQDPQYQADAALRAFQRRQKLDELTQTSANAKIDRDEMVRRLGDSRGQAVEQTRITANKQGLFYSGQLGKRLGDVETDFARRQSDMQRDYDRGEAARAAARRAIEAGAPLEEASALAGAATHQVNADSEAADMMALAANPPAAAASRPAAAPTVKPVNRNPASRKPRRRGTTASHSRRPIHVGSGAYR